MTSPRSHERGFFLEAARDLEARISRIWRGPCSSRWSRRRKIINPLSAVLPYFAAPLGDAETNAAALQSIREAWSATVVVSRRVGRAALKAGAVFAVGVGLAGMAVTYRVYFDRSSVPNLEAFISFEPPSIGEVRDARGTVLIEVAREYRRIVTYDEIPPVVRHAILAAEDNNFFAHSGIEYRSWPRVAFKTARATLLAWWRGTSGAAVRLPQGGSTLTQQLVRGYFLQDLTSRENGKESIGGGLAFRGLGLLVGVANANKLYRKIEEARLSLWLEQEMRERHGSVEAAKKEIFARYASFIYLGHGRYGFAAASEYYFGKPLGSLVETDAALAALLAGISKAPRDYAPDGAGGRPLWRRNQILALMASKGYLDRALAKSCQQQPIVLADRSAARTLAPAAIEHVFDELNERGGEHFRVQDLIEGRIAVTSTIQRDLQTIVNEALERGLAQYEKRHPAARGVIQGSVVVLRNRDAAILAEAGGREIYRDRRTRYSDLNRAADSLRQPGSVWKPIVYLAAFRQGLQLSSVVPDAPTAVHMGGGRIKWIANYDGLFKGEIPVRQALAESRNAAAVWIARWVGIEKINSLAARLGITTKIQPYITSALGASEVTLVQLAGAYRAIASGILAEPYIVERVVDAAGRPLYRATDTTMSAATAGIGFRELEMVQEGLRGVVRLPGGTAKALDGSDFPIPVMGKTGTTSEYRDALFVGSTYGEKGITVAVRIGFDDNSSLGEKETGGRAALPIFREVMLRAYKDRLVGPVPMFPSRIEARIDQYLGLGQETEATTPSVASATAGAVAVSYR